MRNREELTKEERQKERAHRKRKIKEHLQHKELVRKEKNRELGVSLSGDRFAEKAMREKLAQKKKKGEK